jgi:DNA repair protein RadC
MQSTAPAPARAGAGGTARALVPVYRCRLERTGSRPAAPGPIRTPAAAAACLRAVMPEGPGRMHVYALALDAKSQVLGAYEVAVGTLDAALLCPRECLKTAILLNAASLILGLNHVSGDPEPSLETATVARNMAIACHAVGIPLRDFIILGADSHVSMDSATRPRFSPWAEAASTA